MIGVYITLAIVAIVAITLYLMREKIKAWLVSKAMEYASKKMMENVGDLDLTNFFEEEKKK